MFDTTKPNNNIPKLPREDLDFDNITLLKRVIEVNNALAKLNLEAQTLPNPEILLQATSMRESINSNEIENIQTTLTDAFIAELEDKKNISQPNKETINYKDAMICGWQRIKEKGGIGYNEIEEINKIITESNEGIMSSPNKRITNSKTKDILYTPPQGINLIKELVHNFADYYNNFDSKEEVDPLLKLPLLHYQLEAIHPFGEGNGRTGRILIVLYLVLHGKIDYPILFISDYIQANKKDYYDFLRQIDGGEKDALFYFTHWLLLGIQLQAYVTRITILKIKDLWYSTKRAIEEDKELGALPKDKICNFLFSTPFYTIESMSKKLDIHRQTASNYLKSLKSKDILDSFKDGRNIIYFNSAFLKLLEQNDYQEEIIN